MNNYHRDHQDIPEYRKSNQFRLYVSLESTPHRASIHDMMYKNIWSDENGEEKTNYLTRFLCILIMANMISPTIPLYFPPKKISSLNIWPNSKDIYKKSLQARHPLNLQPKLFAEVVSVLFNSQNHHHFKYSITSFKRYPS